MRFSRQVPLFLLLLAASFMVPGVLPADPVDLKQLDRDVFDRLTAKADENVNITLDGKLLKLAAGMFGDAEDKDAARVKKLISGLTSITVRNLSFKKKGDYTPEDVRLIRQQMQTPDWSRIVDVTDKSQEEHSEIYVLPGKEHPSGLFILVTEPRELTVVYILGTIDVNDLASLEELGVPDIMTKQPRSSR